MTQTSSGSPLGPRHLFNKVPHVTVMFWIVKILATTLGETGGDALSMTLNLGYLVSTFIFLGFFAVTLAAQVNLRRYHPAVYWAVVVATTTVGTTTSDYLDRTVGLGYPLASALLFSGVLVVLITWRLTLGRIEFQHIVSRPHEIFYWLTILVSNTLGTALGDYAADDTGLDLGFEKGALVFGALLLVIAGLYFLTRIPRSYLFWGAYILTRPLGATVGDVVTKPHDEGGLALGRISSSLAILGLMVVGIVLMSLWRGKTPKMEEAQTPS